MKIYLRNPPFQRKPRPNRHELGMDSLVGAVGNGALLLEAAPVGQLRVWDIRN